MARYIILGAGAVGGAIGARLTLAGRGVVLVARGDHLAAILEHGLRLRTPDEDLTQQLTAIGGPEEIQLDVDDILILATKTQQANEMLVRWTDSPVHQNGQPVGTAGECLPIFVALNGVAGEAFAHRYFRQVYGVCVWMPVVHLQPGEVISRSTPTSGMLHIGHVPKAPKDHDHVLRQVADDLIAANFDAMAKRVSRDAPGSWPSFAAGLCGGKDRADVEAFWRDRIANYAGGERTLKQALEQIDLCTGLRAAQQQAVAAFLAKH